MDESKGEMHCPSFFFFKTAASLQAQETRTGVKVYDFIDHWNWIKDEQNFENI